MYGLCADPRSEEAVRRLYRLKGRAELQPTALVGYDADAVVAAIPELRGQPLLPGPYTLILPNPAGRFPWLTGERPDTIGVRVPELSGDAAGVLEQVGVLAATSANLPGGRDPRRLEDVPWEIRDGCGALVEGGELPGVASTVVDLTGSEPVILREGTVPAEEALRAVAAARRG